jgi:hypothetical protein
MKNISLTVLAMAIIFSLLTGCPDFNPPQGPGGTDGPEPLTLAQQQSIASDFIVALAYILNLDPVPVGITREGIPEVVSISNYSLPSSYTTDVASYTPEFIKNGSVINGTITILDEDGTRTFTVNLSVNDQAIPGDLVAIVVNLSLTSTSASITLQVNNVTVTMDEEEVEEVFSGV